MQDVDRRTLAKMVLDNLARGGFSTHAIAQQSYTASMFEVFLRLAAELNARPKHVVIPFNLRCLSPQWHASPMWQFTQDHAAVEAQIVDPSAPVAALKPVWENLSTYHATAFASPLTTRRTIGDFKVITRKRPLDLAAAEERRRELLIFHYGMPARRAHRNLNALAAAVQAATSLGARTLVYIAPINIDLIRRIGGTELVGIISANAKQVEDMVLNAVADRGQVAFHNWHGALPASGFFHENELTEHLCTEGRLVLADLIVNDIVRASGLCK